MSRVLFIVLSGIVASAAILQYFPDKTEPVYVEAQSDFIVPEGTHDAVVKAIADRDSAQLNAVVKAVSSPEFGQVPEKIHVVLADPAKAPSIVHESEPEEPSSLLAGLRDLDILKDARIAAVVDMEGGKVAESEKPEDALALLKEIRTAGVSANGVMRHELAGEQMIASWACRAPNGPCLLTDRADHVKLPDAAACRAAGETFLTCGRSDVDTVRFFGASECRLDDARHAVAEVLARQTDKSGTIDVNGVKYHFEKTDTASKCSVATAVVMPAAEAVPADIAEAPQKMRQYDPREVLLAVGGGIVFALIGFVCTRRRKEENAQAAEEPKEREKSAQQEDKNSAELESAKKEIEAQKKKIKRLEEEAELHSHETAQLNEQLEYARSAFKKEQIMRMGLDEEKKRLEDMIATSGAPQTVVDKAMHYAVGDYPAIREDDSEISLPPAAEKAVADHSPVPVENDAEAVTKVPEKDDTLLKEEDEAAKSGFQEMFDAFGDDGWDEIAESFDSIMQPHAGAGDSAQKSVLDMIENEVIENEKSDDDSAFGMTGFLSAIKNNERRRSESGLGVSKSDTQTRLKPISEPPKLTSIPSIANVPEISSKPGLPAAPPLSGGLKTETLSGIGSKLRPLEREVPPSAAEMAVMNPGEKKNDSSFKPAPSWTGRNIADAPADAGIDSHSLYDALKRRVKDVSEMEMPSVPNASGAFDFNRSLSKSGVFSLTGSRVDIDPFADNEYFKLLYEQFIQTQRECGEPTDKFTLEQFVSRLAREKERLMKNYKCSNVRFSVYVKDGKASLKATPQK